MLQVSIICSYLIRRKTINIGDLKIASLATIKYCKTGTQFIQMYILLLNQVKWWCAVKYTKYFFASLASKFLFLCPFFFHGYFLVTMPIDRWGEVNTCNFKYMKYYVCTSFTNLYMYTYYIVILGVDFTLSTYWKTLHLPLKLLHIGPYFWLYRRILHWGMLLHILVTFFLFLGVPCWLWLYLQYFINFS